MRAIWRATISVIERAPMTSALGWGEPGGTPLPWGEVRTKGSLIDVSGNLYRKGAAVGESLAPYLQAYARVIVVYYQNDGVDRRISMLHGSEEYRNAMQFTGAGTGTVLLYRGQWTYQLEPYVP